MSLPSPTKLARKLAGKVRRTVRDWIRGETDATFVNLFDANIINPILEVNGVRPLALENARPSENVVEAKWWILALIASRPDLRQQYPRALSDGYDGAFARFLCQRDNNPFGLDFQAIQNIEAAFRSNPEVQGQRIYEYRSDLRTAFPVGPCPPQRGVFLDWFLRYGRFEDKLSAEYGIWWLFAVDERPDRGLLGLFASQPTWQADVPLGNTIFGWEDLQIYLSRNYKLRGRWLKRAKWQPTLRPWDEITLLLRTSHELKSSFPKSPTYDLVEEWLKKQPISKRLTPAWLQKLKHDFERGLPTQPGVNVLAHFTYPSGLQEAAFGLVRDLHRIGVRTARRDLPALPMRDSDDREVYQDPELFDTTIYVAATNSFPSKWYARTGLNPRPDVRKIAMWFWELDRVPEEWLPEMRWADEVWAVTEFMAAAFRRSLSVPVISMLPSLEIQPFSPRPKSYFQIPDDRFLFLFSFDMGSVMKRKNPLAVIEAFRRAVRPDDRAHLAIKVSRGNSDAASLAELTAACQQVGATLIDQVLPRSDTLALLNVSDCYISLHRSEGLGLGLAESMAMKKPVIATAYSGNVDFMTPDCSRLVDYKLITIEDEGLPYPKGCQWADPSVAHAAEHIRWVLDHREEARALGERAARHIRTVMSPEASAERIRMRLNLLRVTGQVEHKS